MKIDISQPEAQVLADIRLIERVFENLLENALRYTPEYGHIVVALKSQESGVQVTISDDGSGISEEVLPHIFDRFFHSNEGTQQDMQSTGLGLAIVKRSLELHDTAISVSSKLKKGTEFSFSLPTPASNAFA